MEPFFNNFDKLLFSKDSKLGFDPLLSGQILFQNNQSNQTAKYFIQMFSPSIETSKFLINLVNQEIVKCQIKIDQGSQILFGIGLKEKLKSIQFEIDQKMEKYGCFIESFGFKTYVVMKDGESKILNEGVNFSQGQVVVA